MIISNVCKLSGVKIYQLPIVKCFDGKSGKFCMFDMFTLKECSNKLCNMEHLMPTDMDKAYPEQLVKILITGVLASVTKPEGEKGG